MAKSVQGEKSFFPFLSGSLCAKSGWCRGERHRGGGAAAGARRPPSGLLSGCAQFPSQDAVGHHTRGNESFSLDTLSSIFVTVVLIISQCVLSLNNLKAGT